MGAQLMPPSDNVQNDTAIGVNLFDFRNGRMNGFQRDGALAEQAMNIGERKGFIRCE